ncbi:hypothetical protein L3X38_002767 [Prunus dulcis]|uniref:Uncharacterized protein n=1 Tax=Prunus dulcis TaxID=3755 RepID=A0AAD4WZ13_PRUDU|nr:hypothetical protein L3X38_002767 [Prunus dulcis]
MSRCLERQERETKERRRRQAEGKRVQRELDQQVVMAVALLEEENQGRRHGSQVGRSPNVDRHRHSRGDYGNRKGQKNIILEAVVGFDTWV